MSETMGNELISRPKSAPEIKATVQKFGDTTILMAEEVVRKFHANYRDIRTAIEEDLRELTAEPFGSRSVDPNIRKPKRTAQAMKLRTVNNAGQQLHALFPDLQIAIKGTGKGIDFSDPDREDLTEQFEAMRRLKMGFNTAPQAFRNIFQSVDVYGVLSYPSEAPEKQQEWLFMEYIPNARNMGEYKLTGMLHGQEQFGFDPVHHPRMAELVKNNCPPKYFQEENGYISFRSVRRMIEAVTGVGIKDLHGRDILCIGEKGNEQYRLIDIKKSELK